jgi:hypothetical protein
LSPKKRQSNALRPPQASSKIQGNVHRKNLFAGDLFNPSGIKALSIPNPPVATEILFASFPYSFPFL